MEFIKSKLSHIKTSQSGAGNLDASSNCELLSAYGRLDRTPDGYHAHFVPNSNVSGNRSNHWFHSLFVTEDQRRLKTDGPTNGQQYTKWGPPAPGETKPTIQAIALGKEFTKRPTKERSEPGFILAKRNGGWQHHGFRGGLVSDISTPIWGSTDADQRYQATEFAILNAERSVHVTDNSSPIPRAYRKGYSKSPTTSNSAVQFLTPSAEVPGLEQLYFRDGELTAVYDRKKAIRIHCEMTERQSSATANAYPESYHGQEKQGYYGYPGTPSGSGQGTQYQSR